MITCFKCYLRVFIYLFEVGSTSGHKRMIKIESSIKNVKVVVNIVFLTIGEGV